MCYLYFLLDAGVWWLSDCVVEPTMALRAGSETLRRLHVLLSLNCRNRDLFIRGS